jgi:hypothetical protein
MEPSLHFLRYLSFYVRCGQWLAVGGFGTCTLWMLKGDGTYTRCQLWGHLYWGSHGQGLRASLYCCVFNPGVRAILQDSNTLEEPQDQRLAGKSPAILPVTQVQFPEPTWQLITAYILFQGIAYPLMATAGSKHTCGAHAYTQTHTQKNLYT